MDKIDEKDFFRITVLKTKVIITTPTGNYEEGRQEIVIDRQKHTEIVRSTENKLKSILFTTYYIHEDTGVLEILDNGPNYYIYIEKK